MTVTINSAHTFAFSRAYIAGFACFADDVSCSFEGLTIIINDEVRGRRVSLYVNSEVYPARSRMYTLDQVFEDAECIDLLTGSPVDLTIDMWVGVPPTYSDACICIAYAGAIEATSFFNLPDMPPSYWNPVLSNGKF